MATRKSKQRGEKPSIEIQHLMSVAAAAEQKAEGARLNARRLKAQLKKARRKFKAAKRMAKQEHKRARTVVKISRKQVRNIRRKQKRRTAGSKKLGKQTIPSETYAASR